MKYARNIEQAINLIVLEGLSEPVMIGPLVWSRSDGQSARSAIFEYLECFYNPVRLHSTLSYVSPLAFEQAYQSRMS